MDDLYPATQVSCLVYVVIMMTWEVTMTIVNMMSCQGTIVRPVKGEKAYHLSVHKLYKSHGEMSTNTRD